MHQSANDILSISTNRETVLIGPPGAFGVIHRDDILVGRGEIEHAMAHIFTIPGIEDVMRANARRFGMEASALKRLDGRALRAWLTGQAVRGALAIAIVPDPVVAFAAFVHRQEHAMDQASSLRKTLPEDEALPRDMERRFLIAMDMVPDHLHGEAKKKFDDMVASVGMESIAVGLLIWLGAHFVPGLNLVVLAFDLFFLSGEVLRAMEMVGHCIEQVQKATKRSELEEIAKVLAAAIAVLVVNGVLSRLLRAKQVTRGQTQSSARGRGGFDKPKAEHRPVRQKQRPRLEKPDAAAAKPADAPAKSAPPTSGDKKPAASGAAPSPHFAKGIDDGTKRALADFGKTDGAKVSKDLDGKKVDEVKKYMSENYPDVKPQVNPDLKVPKGQAGKVVQTKWELPDGTVVRVKETEPIGGKVDNFRKEPSLSVSALKRDGAGKVLPDSYENEAFKIAGSGAPVPKGPMDVDTDGMSKEEAKKTIDAVMNAGHRSLER